MLKIRYKFYIKSAEKKGVTFDHTLGVGCFGEVDLHFPDIDPDNITPLGAISIREHGDKWLQELTRIQIEEINEKE